MDPGLLVVYNEMKANFPTAFVYYDVNQMLSEESKYTIIQQTAGIVPADPLDPNYQEGYVGVSYVDFVVQSPELAIILTDRQINVAFKYNATLDDIVYNKTIIRHFVVNVAGTNYDCLRIINVPVLVDPFVELSLVLINSMFLSTRPYEVNNFTSRKNCLFAGANVSIQISTKFDKDRVRIDEYEHEAMRYIMRHHRKFDIYDGVDKKGYYKLVDTPKISGYVNNLETIQQIIVDLYGYYLVFYKCNP